MKRSKLFLGIVSLALFGALGTKVASANEGIIRLSGTSEDLGRCFATSVYLDGSYRVLMTCRNLKMALDPVKNRYVVWAQAGTTNQRLGEVVSGKMESSVDAPFERLFVTLEKDSYPYDATGRVVLAGQVEAIDFGKGIVDASVIKLSPTPTIKEGQQIVLSPTAAPASGLVTVVSGIGKAILIGFILLLVIVGVMGFLARRKSL